jgi:ornithine cyclodeaminase
MNAQTQPSTASLDARATAALLPWTALADEIEALLRQLQNSCSVSVPPRIVMPTAAGNCLFCMPATDGQVVMTKLISFTPGNARWADLPFRAISWFLMQPPECVS